MVSKVKSLIMLSLGLVAALLMGTVSPATAAAPVTLTIETFGDVIEPSALIDYKKIHPEITIKTKVSSMDALSGNLITYYQSHKGPDIAAIETSYSGLWRSHPEAFVDLSKSPYNANTIKNNYASWRWSQGTGDGGQVIGIPTDIGGLEVAYRIDLFKKAGLPTDPKKVAALWPTWDKFVATGQKYLKAPAIAKSPKSYKGFIDSGGTIFNAVLNQGTEKMYNPTTKKPDYKNAQVKRAFLTASSALTAPITTKRKGIGARYQAYTGDWYIGMKNGAYATMLAPAWQLEYIKRYAPTTKNLWNIAAVPGGGGNIGGSQLTIPKYAQHKQQAWDFISWYLSPHEELKIFRTYGLFPATDVLFNSSKHCVGTRSPGFTKALTAADCAAVRNYKDTFFGPKGSGGAPVGAIYANGAASLNSIFEGRKERGITQYFNSALGRIENGQAVGKAYSQAVAEITKSKP